jgi:hypothetical protein
MPPDLGSGLGSISTVCMGSPVCSLCGKRPVGSRSSATSKFVQGDIASPWSGSRYSFLASTAEVGWNSLAAVGSGQHESPATGHFLRDR